MKAEVWDCLCHVLSRPWHCRSPSKDLRYLKLHKTILLKKLKKTNDKTKTHFHPTLPSPSALRSILALFSSESHLPWFQQQHADVFWVKKLWLTSCTQRAHHQTADTHCYWVNRELIAAKCGSWNPNLLGYKPQFLLYASMCLHFVLC